eukprot:72141-Rhodomonas_salina.1
MTGRDSRRRNSERHPRMTPPAIEKKMLALSFCSASMAAGEAAGGGPAEASHRSVGPSHRSVAASH